MMVYAAAGMALSIFVGSLAGHSDFASIVTATLAAFACGMLVAVGPSAAFVGLQSVVAVLIAGGFPTDPAGAAIRAAIVLGGGLVQTLLVVIIWPLRRFSAERNAMAAAYRSLARYASGILAAEAAAPEPHTFAATESPLADPQPFARDSDVLVFQALLDEAERIRASLAALATRQRQLLEAHPSCAKAARGGPNVRSSKSPPHWKARAIRARRRRSGSRSRPVRGNCRTPQPWTRCSDSSAPPGGRQA